MRTVLPAMLVATFAISALAHCKRSVTSSTAKDADTESAVPTAPTLPALPSDPSDRALVSSIVGYATSVASGGPVGIVKSIWKLSSGLYDRLLNNAVGPDLRAAEACRTGLPALLQRVQTACAANGRQANGTNFRNYVLEAFSKIPAPGSPEEAAGIFTWVQVYRRYMCDQMDIDAHPFLVGSATETGDFCMAVPETDAAPASAQPLNDAVQAAVEGCTSGAPAGRPGQPFDAGACCQQQITAAYGQFPTLGAQGDARAAEINTQIDSCRAAGDQLSRSFPAGSQAVCACAARCYSNTALAQVPFTAYLAVTPDECAAPTTIALPANQRPDTTSNWSSCTILGPCQMTTLDAAAASATGTGVGTGTSTDATTPTAPSVDDQ